MLEGFVRAILDNVVETIPIISSPTIGPNITILSNSFKQRAEKKGASNCMYDVSKKILLESTQ